jgi:O-antigen ligase
MSSGSVVRPGYQRRVGSTRARHRLHDYVAAALVLLVAVAPLPLASNRPLFWMLSAVYVALLGCGYGIWLLAIGTTARKGLRDYRIEACLFVGIVLYLGVQCVPLDALVPLGLRLPAGGEVRSSTISMSSGDTWLMLLSMLGYGVFAYLVLQTAANAARARVMLAAAFAIVVALAIYGLVALNFLGDTILGTDKSSYQGFATATFVNRNAFATFLAAGLSLGLALVLETAFGEAEGLGQARIPLTLFGLVGLAFVFGALLATASRMGIVAGVAGAVVTVAFWLVASRRRFGFRLVIVAGVAIIAVGLLSAAFGPQLFERLIWVNLSDEGRLPLYQQVWDMIMARPLLGYGGNTFAVVFPAFQQPSLAGDLIWDKAHSTYLALWAELGLVVGSFPMVATAMMTAKAVVASANPGRRAASCAAVGVVTACALHATVDFGLEIQAVTWLFLFVLAVGAAGYARGAPPRSQQGIS